MSLELVRKTCTLSRSGQELFKTFHYLIQEILPAHCVRGGGSKGSGWSATACFLGGSHLPRLGLVSEGSSTSRVESSTGGTELATLISLKVLVVSFPTTMGLWIRDLVRPKGERSTELNWAGGVVNSWLRVSNEAVTILWSLCPVQYKHNSYTWNK
jgi:hypothetical protein